jgi:putative transposase
MGKPRQVPLKRFYWGEKTLWSDGYFASTIGNVSKVIAEAYIRNQG